MTAHVIGTGIASESSIAKYRVDCRFRKATSGMLYALDAAEQALRDSQAKPAALILGTSHGELETTKDFLFHLDQSGAARPFLFQNSLHHSTAGFLGLTFRIEGPSITTSNGCFSAENALELAMLTLAQSSPILVVTVEGPTTDIHEAVQGGYPPGIILRAGAAAVVLSREPSAKTKACLKEIRYLHAAGPLTGDFYDSNALERWIEVIQTQRSIILPKPDSQASEWIWTA